MEVKAVYRNARISPKKMRDICREIQGLPVGKAADVLKYTPKKGALILIKTLKSAVANAEHNCSLAVDTLVVSSARVDEGSTFKRSMPRARGSANPIRRRSSHVTVIVSNKD